MRVTPIVFAVFTGNAFAASDGRSDDPSRLDFANTAAFRSMLEKPSPSSVTGQTSPNRREAEVLVAVPPRTPSNADLVLEESVPQKAPSEAIPARIVHYASIDDNPPHPASRHKRRQRLSMPNPSVGDQAKPSLLQKIFGAVFQGD